MHAQPVLARCRYGGGRASLKHAAARLAWWVKQPAQGCELGSCSATGSRRKLPAPAWTQWYSMHVHHAEIYRIVLFFA
jgi:hypothetical protein